MVELAPRKGVRVIFLEFMVRLRDPHIPYSSLIFFDFFSRAITSAPKSAPTLGLLSAIWQANVS